MSFGPPLPLGYRSRAEVFDLEFSRPPGVDLAERLDAKAAVAKFGLRNSIREGYIDCIPALLPYYKALGFVQTGPQFLHRENGPSRPMKLDLDRHGKKLATKYESGGVGGLFLKATLIRLRDAVLGERSPTESREARR